METFIVSLYLEQTLFCDNLSFQTVSDKSDIFQQQQPTNHFLKKYLHRKRKRSHVSVEEQPSCCASCQDVLKDPVSTSCGHWFCRQCISPHTGTSLLHQETPPVPSVEKDPEPRAGLQTASQTSSVQNGDVQEVLYEYKISLRRRCEHVTEGTDEAGSGTLLNRIYTELYITEGQSEEVNTQHEVRQLETANKMKTLHETPIKCHTTSLKPYLTNRNTSEWF
ncbi:hypothetical protein L3Q82_008467 [Scortum barcoo]|uniref:Uncharacterized protein n=1 Tax=Scortum barcoo TaxID=214431 RepID=A0ACB8XDR2_9TELE|nr:hypothetical protein L3Q82_008467 [Scortum barcoo]